MALTNSQPALEPQRTERVAEVHAHACAQAPPSPHWECPSPRGSPKPPSTQVTGPAACHGDSQARAGVRAPWIPRNCPRPVVLKVGSGEPLGLNPPLRGFFFFLFFFNKMRWQDMKAVPWGFREVWTSRLRRALHAAPIGPPPSGLATQREAELGCPHTNPQLLPS